MKGKEVEPVFKEIWWGKSDSKIGLQPEVLEVEGGLFLVGRQLSMFIF